VKEPGYLVTTFSHCLALLLNLLKISPLGSDYLYRFETKKTIVTMKFRTLILDSMRKILASSAKLRSLRVQLSFPFGCWPTVLCVILLISCSAHLKDFFAEHPNDLVSGTRIALKQIEQFASRDEVKIGVLHSQRPENQDLRERERAQVTHVDRGNSKLRIGTVSDPTGAAIQPLTKSRSVSADLTTCHNVQDQCSACHANKLIIGWVGQGMGHVMRHGSVDYVSGGGEH
jgi:hypothetical protein